MSYDIIIIGAGPAGSTTAYFLQKFGYQTLLLDKSDFPRDKTCGDGLSPRAQAILESMNLLETVAAQAHHAQGMYLFAPNGERAQTRDISAANLSKKVMVLPRYTFDHIVQQSAIQAGAVFEVGHVKNLIHEGGRVAGVMVNGREERAKLVIVATGAATGILDEAGLKPKTKVHSVAARRYVNGLSDVTNELKFMFNEIPLPGYAWFFPTGKDSANVGFWYSGAEKISSRAKLDELLSTHSFFKSSLNGGSDVGAIKSYPIRSDFLTAPKLAPGVLAVGEAAGLVNPFTGEGIDYALEAGQVAATVIRDVLAANKPLTVETLQPYVGELNRHFRRLFWTMNIAHDYAFNHRIFNNIFAHGERKQELIDALIQVCFGAADPLQLVKPRYLYQIATG